MNGKLTLGQLKLNLIVPSCPPFPQILKIIYGNNEFATKISYFQNLGNA